MELQNYIVFLLGTDNFDICKKIREQGKSKCDMFDMFEKCNYIASRFCEYDKRNADTMGEYESFTHFLQDYNNEINNFVENDTDFEIREV